MSDIETPELDIPFQQPDRETEDSQDYTDYTEDQSGPEEEGDTGYPGEYTDDSQEPDDSYTEDDNIEEPSLDDDTSNNEGTDPAQETTTSEEDTDSNAWSYDGMTIYMSTYYGYGDETLLDNIEGQWRDALKDMSGSEPMEVNSSIGKYPTYRLISDLVDNQTGDQITFIVWCFATEDEDVHDIVLVGPSYDVKAVSKSIVATYEYGSFQFNY